jgi:hypothetical protein
MGCCFITCALTSLSVNNKAEKQVLELHKNLSVIILIIVTDFVKEKDHL